MKWRPSARHAFPIALAVLLAGFTIPLSYGLGALGASPSAWIVCPLQCDQCRGPGRQFLWRYRGAWQENKGRMGSALVCSHPSLSLQSMTWADVTARSDALQPFILGFLVVHVVDSLVLAALVATVVWVFVRRR